MRFRNLSVLWLNNCGLKGQIPYSIGDMWALKHLNLGDNKLTGRLPDSWGSLNLLEVLDIRQNKLKGNLPRSFRELSSLVQLDLSYNKLSGEIPKDRFLDLTGLKWLNLSNCNFLDTEKSHRELQQSLPTTLVTVHVPKRVCTYN
jgi:Leucine-rich repeat (LRR) protein